MKKIISLWGLCFLMLVLLAGCRKRFDPSGYIQAVLDLSIKGDEEPVKKYVKDTKDIQELKEETMEQWDSSMEAEFEGADVSEAIQQEWKELMLDILKESKYTVGEAEKTKDGYEMQVEVEPITGVFDDLEAPTRERMAAYAKENKEKILDGTIPPEEADDEVSVEPITGVFDGYVGVIEDAAQEIMNGTSIETNIYDVAFRNLAKTATENMNNLSYAEPQTAIVHVSEAEDGSYEASDEDLGNVFGQTIAMPDMESLF